MREALGAYLALAGSTCLGWASHLDDERKLFA
jgi:hypothetical protein